MDIPSIKTGQQLYIQTYIATVYGYSPQFVWQLVMEWVSSGLSGGLMLFFVVFKQFPNPRQRFALRIWPGTIQVSRSR